MSTAKRADENEKDGVRQRLFIAVYLPGPVVDEVTRIQKELESPSLFKGRFTKPLNLHLTMKFLGEVSTGDVEPIRAALRDVSLPSFEATLGELGVFSGRGQIRIVWAHIAGEPIVDLQRRVDSALSPAFEPEHRFMSHLTIARVKSIADRRRLLRTIDGFVMPGLEFAVTEFKLKRSVLSSAGPTYTDIDTYPLA